MGWGHGRNWEGREIGYMVGATCEQPGCTEEIDLGLGYVCGRLDTVLSGPTEDEPGCGHYFCGKHLMGSQLCEACFAKPALRRRPKSGLSGQRHEGIVRHMPTPSKGRE